LLGNTTLVTVGKMSKINKNMVDKNFDYEVAVDATEIHVKKKSGYK